MKKCTNIFFHDCLGMLLLVLTSLKMHRSLKNEQFLVKKLRNLHKYCPTSIELTFSTKFILEAKAQNGTSWNISNLRLCGNSLALSLKSEWVLSDAKINQKCKFHGDVDRVRDENAFPQTALDKSTELHVLQLIFCNVVAQLSKFVSWVTGWVLSHQFQASF